MALCLALALTGACSDDSNGDAKAVNLSERTVPNAIAAFQSAEGPGCGEGDCTQHLRRLVGDIRALGQAMYAAPNGEQTFAKPLKIVKDMERELPGNESAEVDDFAREPALSAARALKQWIANNPKTQ
ncbi:hypothetical protein [Streptomyces zagrosensis]|uniref:Uncharacterized protein n=1 Tax=Streptomyces zagrosensis TaxID=1042984 RepID=A0A7W9QA75_9ACTN|nr:hypothetical protein [Streptomyces zagrosensis]MBB5935272.1 hypothetical protein [Streptomyces zagrosensis]